MPSDAKKREQQRKKDAAKARQAGKKNEKPKNEDQNDVSKTNGVNGSENGSTEMSAEGKIGLCCHLLYDIKSAEIRISKVLLCKLLSSNSLNIFSV